MAGLVGLSPQEISAIGARRDVTESNRYKQAQMLINMMGTRQQGELAKRKLDLLENPPMVKMKIADQIYEIPRQSQIEGAKAKAEVEERLRTGLIDQAQHDAWMKPVVTSLPSGEGGWVDYEVPSGMLQQMAGGIKSLQDVRVSGVEEDRKRKGVEALGGQTIGDIENIPLSTLAATMPGGVIPAMVAKPMAGVAALRPEERRKLIVDHEKSADDLRTEFYASDASIAAYNDRSKTLDYPSMMFRGTADKTFLGITYGEEDKPIEVKLPVANRVQMTPTDIFTAAKRKGISVNDRLQEIYEGMIVIEHAEKIKANKERFEGR